MVYAIFNIEKLTLFFRSYIIWAQACYQTDQSLNITSITFLVVKTSKLLPLVSVAPYINRLFHSITWYKTGEVSDKRLGTVIDTW